MAKTKTPRSTSPRTKKNGTEVSVTPAVAPAADSLAAPIAPTPVAAAPIAVQEVKPEFKAAELKSDAKETRKAYGEPRRTVIPINLDEEIRRRAYQIYEERGCTPGHENDDWRVAEREVLLRYNTQQQHTA